MRHAVSFSLWRSVHPQDNPQTGLEIEDHFLRFIHTECEWHGFSKGDHSYSHWVKSFTYWKPNKFSVEGVFVEEQHLLYRVNSVSKNVCVDRKTRTFSIPSFDMLIFSLKDKSIGPQKKGCGGLVIIFENNDGSTMLQNWGWKSMDQLCISLHVSYIQLCVSFTWFQSVWGVLFKNVNILLTKQYLAFLKSQ